MEPGEVPETALAVQAALAGRWATAVADRTHREPGIRHPADLLPGRAPGTAPMTTRT
ncbi:DUF6207 family protein [Streptomyces sp. NPDC058642]|uniref:DUF6207 family protein n=1 Tax=Streptomyces sp. NPDC058642 TaxID=3346572 RepID=UPI00364A0502